MSLILHFSAVLLGGVGQQPIRNLRRHITVDGVVLHFDQRDIGHDVRHRDARNRVQEMGVRGGAQKAEAASHRGDQDERSFPGEMHENDADQGADDFGRSEQNRCVVLVDRCLECVEDLKKKSLDKQNLVYKYAVFLT